MPTTKYSRDDINQWDANDVAKWLTNNRLTYLVEEFKSNHIDGQRLLLLSWDEFKTLECLQEEKRKKAFKKVLSTLPGANYSSSKQKGGGGGTKIFGKKEKQQVPLPPQPTTDFPLNAPALPPRPTKPNDPGPPPGYPGGSLPPNYPAPPPNYPAPPQPAHIQPPHMMQSQPMMQPMMQSQPPLPSRNIPPPGILSRPPIQHPPSGGGGSGFQSEDIYDAVHEDPMPPPNAPIDSYNDDDDDIYDDGNFDSFEEGTDTSGLNNSSSNIRIDEQPVKKFATLEAKFHAHGIGNSPQYNDDDGDELYDEVPPPPPDDPPADDNWEDEIYYEEDTSGHLPPPPPSAPPTNVNEFGYGEDDEIYDMADPDDMNKPIVPSQQPINSGNGYIDEEIYDTMDLEEEPTPAPPAALPPKPPQAQLNNHPGIQPFMRPPIQTNSHMEGETIPSRFNKPGVTTTSPSLRRAPIEANVPQPPMPSRITKHQPLPSSSSQEAPPPPSLPAKPPVANTFQQLSNNQGIPPPPCLPAKPAPTAFQQPSNNQGVPPPPPPAPPVSAPDNNMTGDDDNTSEDGGSLAAQLAKMKGKLRSNSNASGSSSVASNSPSSGRRAQPQPLQQQKAPAPQPSAAGGDDLMSSIKEIRMRLRTGASSPKPPAKNEINRDSPSTNQILKPSDLKKGGGTNFQANKPDTPTKPKTPPLSDPPDEKPKPILRPPIVNKTEKSDKQQIGHKPSIPTKPAVAPKGKNIANIMKSFQQQQHEPEPKPIISPVHSKPPPPALDRSPMTGTRMDRKTSVKDLTEKYSSPPPDDLPAIQPPSLLKKQPPPLPTKLPTSNSSDSISPEPHPPHSPLEMSKHSSKFPLPPRNIPTANAQPSRPPKPGQQSSIPPQLPSKPNNSHEPELPERNLPSKGPPEIPSKGLFEREPPELPGRIPPELPGKGPPELPGRPPFNLPGNPPNLPSRNPPDLPGRNPPDLPGRIPPDLPGRNLPELPGRNPPELPGRIQPDLPGRIPPELPGRIQPVESPKRPPLNEPISPPPPGSTQAPFSSSVPDLPKRSMDDLNMQTWYHKGLSRDQAVAKIKKYQKDGTFVVRDNSRNPGEYSLSLWYGGAIKHLRIRKNADGSFVLGESKDDELSFESVTALVRHHKAEPLVLKSGGDTLLKYECPH